MSLSLIDDEPLKEGWGRVYQCGVIASQDPDVPLGLIVSMSGNENLWSPCLWLDMADNDQYVLPDTALLSVAEAILAFLAGGFNVLIHCNEGKYRSTYMDVAVHMRAGMLFEDAFALVRSKHPIADLRAGTMAQLKRMEQNLKGETQ